MREAITETVTLRSKQIAEMLRHPEEHDDIIPILSALVAEVDAAPNPYWRYKWRRAIQADFTLSDAMARFNITFSEDNLPEEAEVNVPIPFVRRTTSAA